MKAAAALLLLSPCALLVSAGAATAQSETAVRSMDVTGSAPEICAMQEGRVQPGGLVNFSGTDGSTLRIVQFTDPSTLAARAASATIEFAAVCNFPHQIRIESQNNGLWPADARVSDGTASFASAVPYEAQVDWGDTSATLGTDGKIRRLIERTASVNEAVAGDLRLRIQILQGASNVANNAPILAGSYSDTLRIYLEPR